MLGDVIGEANGTLTSTEVLSVEQGSPRLRLTLRGSGKAMGVAFTDMITHSLEVRSSGVLYGEGETVWLTEDGEISTWKGFGVGRPTGASGGGTFAVAGSIQTESKKLASLNGVACIVEYQLDDKGNYHWTAYEWKHPSW